MEQDKFYFAQKYKVPEKEILPEFIFLLKAIDHQGKEYENFKKEVSGGIEVTSYQGTWAVIGSKISSTLINILLATICISIVTLLVNYLVHQKAYYKNLEQIGKSINIKDNQYFISKNKVQIKKDGVYILNE